MLKRQTAATGEEIVIFFGLILYRLFARNNRTNLFHIRVADERNLEQVVTMYVGREGEDVYLSFSDHSTCTVNFLQLRTTSGPRVSVLRDNEPDP